jgi:glycosyltransferase involved in cell wall biosynthesis
MAICRVYLPTFRRPQLLQRAVDSLLQQTFQDWVCELHNDDPRDAYPAEFIRRIGDARITLVTHAQNLGAVRTFNLFFKSIAEPFFSLLEDDNWWEPEFLQTMISLMSLQPGVQIGWANMRCWNEEADGSWTDTGRNIWDAAGAEPRLMGWPDGRHMQGAMHSQGAMLARSNFEYFSVPESINLGAIEPFRERTFAHPLLFVPQRLANFSVTRTTARPTDAASWMHAVAVLTGTYISEIGLSAEELRQVWENARKRSRSTHVLFACAAHFKTCRDMIRYATANDWIWSFAYTLRHPLRMYGAMRLFREKKAEEEFLRFHTRRRQAESQRFTQQGCAEISA